MGTEAKTEAVLKTENEQIYFHVQASLGPEQKKEKKKKLPCDVFYNFASRVSLVYVVTDIFRLLGTR